MCKVSRVNIDNASSSTVAVGFVFWDRCGNKKCTSPAANFYSGQTETLHPFDFGVPSGACCAVYARTSSDSCMRCSERFVVCPLARTEADVTISGNSSVINVDLEDVDPITFCICYNCNSDCTQAPPENAQR